MKTLNSVRCVVVAAAISSLAGACAVLDASVDERFDSIDRAAGKARSESVLRNIVRASQKIPLTFLAFSKVSGTTQANINTALPSFSVGPHAASNVLQRDVSLSNTTLSGGALATNSLDFAVLESSDFYRGLLDPFDLVSFDVLIQQGYSRELLLWLWADSVRIVITRADQQPVYVELYNRVHPEESCEIVRQVGKICFRDIVDLAMIVGLSVRVRSGEHVENSISTKTNSGNTTILINTASGQSRIKSNGFLCLDPFYANETSIFLRRHRRDYQQSSAILNLLRIGGPLIPTRENGCYARSRSRSTEDRNKGSEAESFTVTSKRGQYMVSYEVRTRSTFAIYQFLGEILAAQATDKFVMTGLETGTWQYPQILSVAVGRSEKCAVATTLREERYCVPDDDQSRNTKLIFNLLNQLIALKTQTKDLGITPTVRVTP